MGRGGRHAVRKKDLSPSPPTPPKNKVPKSTLTRTPKAKRRRNFFFFSLRRGGCQKRKGKVGLPPPNPKEKPPPPLLYLTNTAFVTVKLRKPSEKGKKGGGRGGDWVGAPIQGWGGWTREKNWPGRFSSRKKNFFLPLSDPCPTLSLAFHAYC